MRIISPGRDRDQNLHTLEQLIHTRRVILTQRQLSFTSAADKYV